MRRSLVACLFLVFVASSVAGGTLTRTEDEVIVNGVHTRLAKIDLGPARAQLPATDTVGGTDNVVSHTGRAKGNSYRVDAKALLTMARFYLNFSDTQTLTYYVFQSPVEFGTYSEVFRASATVTGGGAGWYGSPTMNVQMLPGNFYIVAVSWSGTVTYYYNTGDSQPTSFGAYVHGYAVGYDPLPTSFESTNNDQAIYYQTLELELVEAIPTLGAAGLLALSLLLAGAALVFLRRLWG